MKWGYNWDLGPFETWDAIGFKAGYERMKAEGLSLPASIDKMAESGAEGFYTDDGRVFSLVKGEYEARDIDPRNASLTIMRQGEAPVFSNRGTEAWDLGDGVLGLTFTTKANSIDDTVVEGLTQATEIAERDFRGMVIYNEGDHFCVGANLFAVVMAAQQKAWDQLRDTISGLQNGLQRTKYSTIPVVAAPFGMTVGGGFEVCMGADAVQAASETYVGLVEVGVGLLPGGAGNMNMLWRALEGIPADTDVDTLPFVSRTFQNIAMARVATGAGEAREFGYFRKSDGISFDKARLLTEAKGRAIGMAEAGYHPPVRRAYRLPGESGMATLDMMIDSLQAGGFASEHDALIARKVAMVLCGGPSVPPTRSPKSRCSSSSARRSSASAASRRARNACNTCSPPTSLCGTRPTGTHEPTGIRSRDMGKIVIVDAVRSAVGRAKKGSLANRRPDELAGEVIRKLMERNPNVDPATVEDLVLGCAFPEGEQGMNVARMVGRLGGLPEESSGMTINRFCSSGLQAIALAAGSVKAGFDDVVIAGGMESMTMVPMTGNKPSASPEVMEKYPDDVHADGHHGRERRQPVQHQPRAAG